MKISINKKAINLFCFVCMHIHIMNAQAVQGQKMYVNTGEGLNLRTEPTTKSVKIATIPVLSEVTLIQKSADYAVIDDIRAQWYKVAFGTAVGWVFGGYLSENKETLLRLTGEWQSAFHYFVFYKNGKYHGGRNASGLMWVGKWTFAHGVLYLRGISGDEFESSEYLDKYNVTFTDNDHVKIVDQQETDALYKNEVYTRTRLDWLHE